MLWLSCRSSTHSFNFYLSQTIVLILEGQTPYNQHNGTNFKEKSLVIGHNMRSSIVGFSSNQEPFISEVTGEVNRGLLFTLSLFLPLPLSLTIPFSPFLFPSPLCFVGVMVNFLLTVFMSNVCLQLVFDRLRV